MASSPRRPGQPARERRALYGAPTPSLARGIGFMVLAVSVLPAMNAVAKSLTMDFSVWQVVWARFLGHVLWMVLLFAPTRGLSILLTAHPREQALRSVIFFGSNGLFISALPHVELATASAIMFTTPLIVTALSGPLLGEQVGKWRWGAVVMGFVGALIIVQPGSDVFNPWALLTLGSAACFGFYQIATRKLTSRERPETLIIYTAALGAVIMTLVGPFFAEMPVRPGQWFALVGLGLLGGLGQFFVIKALQHGPASIISPFGYAELVSAVAFGWFVFGNLPGPSTWYGASLIIGAGLVILYRERLRRRRAGAAASP
jgi:drug/metabolite transporter (DMT)-like permease